MSLAREDVFANLPVPTALRKMILPAIFSQLIGLIYNMADTFFVGKSNNPYMVAGTSLILPVFNIPMLLLLNTVIGMYGIVWSQVTADTLTVILSFYVYRKYRPAVEGRKEADGKG